MVPRTFAEWTAPYCFGATTLARNGPLVDHWIERWTASIPARAVLFQGRSWIDKADITGRLAAIHVPTLVVHGEEDVPLPIERALPMVDALPKATFARIAQAGHSVNLEAPAAVNAAIAAFLGRLDLSRMHGTSQDSMTGPGAKQGLDYGRQVGPDVRLSSVSRRRDDTAGSRPDS